MPNPQETYTYQNGRKIVLTKSPDQFVVRATPEDLNAVGIADAERVSPHSSRVQTRSTDLEPMMSRSRHIAPTHHAYYDAESGQEFLVTDRLFVTFKDALPAEEVDAFAGKYGLLLLERYDERSYLFQLTDQTGMNPLKLVAKLTEEDPKVAMADHDLNYRAKRYQFVPPTDPDFARQWHLHTRLNNPDFDSRASARCEQAWQLLNHFGSADVVVGITDDGCKLNHPDFSSPLKFAAWGYFRGNRLIRNTDIDADPAQMYIPGANHGTSCAGVIAGAADAALTVGAAPGCKLLPIQWESDGPSLFIGASRLRTALDFIADKVDVLSNSWGITPRNILPEVVVSRIRELAQNGGRRGRGIVFLWAAGNENCPIQHTTNLNVPFDDGFDNSGNWVGVSTARVFENSLVGVPGLMHIAALSSFAQRSHYSNYGTGILLCSPSSNSHEYHRLQVRGLGITTTTGSGIGVTDRFGGTSSATPLVAGVVALVISANPNLSALEAVSVLKRTAAKDMRVDAYPRTPPALFNQDTSWDISPISPFDNSDFQNINSPDGTWSPWFGHGKVDAEAAVAQALHLLPDVPHGATIRHSSAPARAIPDNNAAGITDIINIADAATVGALKVTLDITHTFIGDLRVTLTAPSGVSVILHNRNGGNADNIQRTFDGTTIPGLSAFIGQATQGAWNLLVQDLAASDNGRLNRWELEIAPSSNTVISLSEAPGTTIPDNTPTGIERQLTVNDSGTLKEIEVSVDITHTFIGDLTATLIAPSGASTALHQRTGGGTDNLIQTYTFANTPALQALRGQLLQGTWRLQVADLEAQDVGKLNRWGLKITKQA